MYNTKIKASDEQAGDIVKNALKCNFIISISTSNTIFLADFLHRVLNIPEFIIHYHISKLNSALEVNMPTLNLQFYDLSRALSVSRLHSGDGRQMDINYEALLKQNYSEEACPSATPAVVNPTQAAEGSNSGL